MRNSDTLCLPVSPALELRPAHLLEAANARGAAMCWGPHGATLRKCECVVARVGRYWRDSFWNVRAWTPDLGCPSTRLRVQFDDTGAAACLEWARTSWHWWLPIFFCVTGVAITVGALCEARDGAFPISAFIALWIGIPLFAVMYDRRARRKDTDLLSCIWREAIELSKTSTLEDDTNRRVIDARRLSTTNKWPQVGGHQGFRVFHRQLDVSIATRIINTIDPVALDVYHVASNPHRHVITVRADCAMLYRYIGRYLPHVRLVLSTSELDCEAEIRIAGLFQLLFTVVFLPVACAAVGVAFLLAGDPMGKHLGTSVCFVVSFALLACGIRRMRHVSAEVRHLQEVACL